MNISTSPIQHSSPAMVSPSTSSQSRDLRNYFRRNVKLGSVSFASTHDHRYCKEQGQEQDHALPTSEVANIDSQKRRSRHRRSEMRTVSEDDALTQRAANPRTGVISPFIAVDGHQQCVTSDYLAVGKEAAKPSPLIRIARKAVGSGTRSRMHEPINSVVLDTDADSKPPTSMRLSQYLPRLEFLHPSHFAKLERSYRRPAHLLPPSLRKPQRDEHAKRTVSTINSDGKTYQRPHIQRQDGKTSVPRIANRSGINDVQPKRPPQLCHCSKCILKSSFKERRPGMPQCVDRRAGPEAHEGANSKAEIDLLCAKPGHWIQGPKRSICLHLLPNIRWIQTRLVEMLSHVFTTLHHASPAVRVLRSPETAKADEYAKALRQVFLAGIYILVLLNLIALFGKALRFLLRIAALVGWPVRALWLILSWVMKE